jgi:hypothetical protein
MLPIVVQDPMAPSALPISDSYQWFTETAASRAPAWRNQVTLRTIEYGFGYEPGTYIGPISPTPLMMIVGLNDHLTVSDLAIAAYERAYEPKRLVFVDAGRSLRRLHRRVRPVGATRVRVVPNALVLII